MPVLAWHNGGDQANAPPKFGMHDYIAYKGLDRAPKAKVVCIRQNLIAYFIGTEAPDTGKTVAGVASQGYHDSGACHCVYFDADGTITRDREMQRVREEFDKAVAALQAGRKEQAAFFAGAMAHYVGDRASSAASWATARIGARRTRSCTPRTSRQPTVAWTTRRAP